MGQKAKWKGKGREIATFCPWIKFAGSKRTSRYAKEQEPEPQSAWHESKTASSLPTSALVGLARAVVTFPNANHVLCY